MARIIDGDVCNLVGSNVRAIRRARHMSQQQLSNRLELLGVYVCSGSVSRIEDRCRTVTDIELFALAKVLDVPLAALFDPPKD